MIGHIANTWILANIFHPLFMAFYFTDNTFFPGGEALVAVLQLMLLSFFISLPSLLLGMLGGVLVARMQGADAMKFLIWAVIAPIIAWLNWMLLGLVAGSDLNFLKGEITIPSMIAVVVSVLLRSHYFFTSVARDLEKRTALGPVENPTDLS